ncbi:MAG: hypothetical protein AAFY35_03070 [Pseudomonadota bacterium]
MIRLLTVISAASFAMPALAQEQQAGNAASTDTEATFQALIDKCDDVDALMLRARIRLQLPHTTEDAAATAQSLLDDGFATCGGGDLEGAREMLGEALQIAEAGANVTYGTADEAATAGAETASAEAEDTPTKDADDRPWWKLW